MANLGRKGDVFVVRFRFNKKEYKKSLKVRDRDEAEAARRLVEVTIHRLLTGQLQIPVGVDPGDFVVSGGTLSKTVRKPLEVRPIRDLVQEYLKAQATYLAPSTHGLFTIHLNHWLRHLGGTSARAPEFVSHADLEGYLRERVAKTSEATGRQGSRTVIQFFRWLVAQGHLTGSPAAGLPRFKAEGDRPPFRTLTEAQAIADREGLSDVERLAAWECVFLSPAETVGLLRMVHGRSADPTSYLFHAIPAFTGVRRGEVLRLTWADVDLTGRLLRARSRKQSRSRRETVRTIDVHPNLLEILTAWKADHPIGQYVLTDPVTGGTYDRGRANRLFWQPMRGTDWCLDPAKNWYKVGYHTYRHSFVSNLAAAGVDQRIIDEFVGHSTDAMRRRYRHLFPEHRRAAIEALKFTVKI